MTAQPAARKKFDVGGVLLDRPFKIRRLNHFGLNTADMDAALHFYGTLLGFRVTDTLDMTGIVKRRFPDLEQPCSGTGYFLQHNSDHHTLVLFSAWHYQTLMGNLPDGVSANQITWQANSMAEVNNAIGWFQGNGHKLHKVGRDMPGSNWHLYMFDPDRHRNEIVYGIEQIGWDGLSKPREMYYRAFHDTPAIPQTNEYTEVQDALARGIDIHSGYRHLDALPANHDVEGIMLPRPFKVVKHGPVGLFVEDLEIALDFYVHELGFTITEEVTYEGHRCVYLRANTEHHSLALYPIEMRGVTGLAQTSTTAMFGCQVASYRQLRNAVEFFKANGCDVVEPDPALHPGIDYAAHVVDPDGHVVQLYYYMEQIGWDGKPRPAAERPVITPGEWPETVPNYSDTYQGETFLGPWG
ncbi:VOC family protein [Kribbella solani]|uniref:VOC family protein n=1 Tax=Kribbella solani TaxID=236067 RepID=UPI0029B8FFD3|nr:VOC family protein [Kribbella solani]MDX3005588.1 VOC family protein [Kribbella solani]